MSARSTFQELIDRYDENTVAELLSDDGKPAEDIEDHPRLNALLNSAKGRVNAAVLVGVMYQIADLTNLETTSNALLHDIECGLVMASLRARRPGRWKSDDIKAFREEWEEYLDKLRTGARLFELVDDTSHEEAGVPTIDGPTTVDYSRLNLIPDRTQNFYPHRGTRLPTNRN